MSKKIIVDCERMRYPNTGLYHFCLQLGKALQVQTAKDSEDVAFYIPKTEKGVFGEKSEEMYRHFMHKHLFPNVSFADVWHCTYQGSNYYPFGRKIPVILTIHDLNFLYDLNLPEAKKRKFLLRLQRKIDHAKHVVAISNFVLEDLHKNLTMNGKACSVIYNGCNVDDKIAITVPDKLYDQPFLFTIGTITEKKNFQVLPALLVNNDLLLIIAGVEDRTNFRLVIEREARKWGVLDRVIFTGAISENDKKWHLDNCLAFVFPSTAEGFGLPVIEAMYYGKPVILSKCTSLPEIGGDCAYYFDNFEPEHMQKVLIDSLEDYNSNQPVEKIKARARSFSWKEAAAKYLALYRSLY
jgi:glycosyltransferase involved in cell wall biosynthesis